MNLSDALQLIEWRQPMWLWLMLQPLLIVLLRFVRQTRQSTQYADKHLLPWVIRTPRISLAQRLLSKNSAYVIAWCLLAIAAAGPRVAKEIPGTEQLHQTNLMLVIDISRSMHATDIQPSRLKRSRLEIVELLQRLPATVRVGVVLFAARPHLYVPYTSDRHALLHYLGLIENIQAPTRGSNLADALQLALNTNTYGFSASAVVLLSDGDIPDTEVNATAMQQLLVQYKAHGTPLYILGMGSVEGDAVPVAPNKWLQVNDKTVISRMNETAMSKLAKNSGGKYSPVYDDENDWRALYDSGMAEQLQIKTGQRNNQHIIWSELYGWVLLPAILLLWLAVLPVGLPKQNIYMLVFVLASTIGGILTPLNADAAESEKTAYQAFRAGKYDQALSLYIHVPGYAGLMGQGASSYMLKNYSAAIQHFSQAVFITPDDTLRARALFNLGNSYYQSGDYAAALACYRDAQLYWPEYAAARHNFDFTRAIKQQVDAQLQTLGSTQRMGKGPRQARAAESLEIKSSGSVSIDESSTPEEQSTLPAILGLSAEQSRYLIDKGLQHIQLADNDERQAISSKDKVTDRYLADRLSRNDKIIDNPAYLWQRLFEIEEGFPAPVTESRTIPGVQSW